MSLRHLEIKKEFQTNLFVFVEGNKGRFLNIQVLQNITSKYPDLRSHWEVRMEPKFRKKNYQLFNICTLSMPFLLLVRKSLSLKNKQKTYSSPSYRLFSAINVSLSCIIFNRIQTCFISPMGKKKGICMQDFGGWIALFLPSIHYLFLRMSSIHTYPLPCEVHTVPSGEVYLSTSLSLGLAM